MPKELKEKIYTHLFTTVWEKEYQMESNGCYCGFNMPESIKSKKEDGEEINNDLPPCNRRKYFLVDEYPACPENWMRSEGKLTSYFIPIKEDSGMWLDLNRNLDHTHEMAVVISVQGINPITGLPCSDPHLEQYIEKCPKCNEAFGPHRFCKTCEYKWAKQNYICTTATPKNRFWLDGFRSADGIVRQYILTQEKIRGVANNIIGKDRVYAIGLSFFLSKKSKKELYPQISQDIYSKTQISNYLHLSHIQSNKIFKGAGGASAGGEYIKCLSNTLSNDNNIDNNSYTAICYSASASSVSSVSYYNNSLSIETQPRSINCKNLEIGAGAKINQTIYDDPNDLTFWKDQPESIICINYCLESDCKNIILKGKVNFETKKESFLSEIQVGN